MKPLLKLYRKEWCSSDEVSVIGWAEWNGTVYAGEPFLQLIGTLINDFPKGKIGNISAVSDWANHLNGTFAVVICSGDYLILIADHIRSYPLMYTCVDGRIIVTDHLLRCKEELQLELLPDFEKCEFFLVAGLVLGEHTLFQHWYGIQAAEVVILSPKSVDRRRFLHYRLDVSKDEVLDLAKEIKKQNIIYDAAFERMIKSAPKVHNWVLPLSGGHDSRMVLYRLYKAGIRNVICYTYGFPGNEQAQISRCLAEALGYPWFFVEYTADKWKEVRFSKDFSAYFDFAFNGVSDPHLQDFLAVRELKDRQVLHDNDIFVPGHTFDFLTGAYCWEELESLDSYKDLCYYLRNYINQWPFRKRSSVVFKELFRCWEAADLPMNQFTEYFFWQERHAKFIQNSLRVYEYFGYDWRTPLWDRMIMDYWQHIPLQYKLYRNFLYQCEKNGLYEGNITAVPFDMEMVPEAKWKRTLSGWFPEMLLRRLKFQLKKNNTTNDPLSTIYQCGNLGIEDLMNYKELPSAVKYYLSPYLKRPLYLNPDNDVNSLFALRNIFSLKR